MGIYWPVPIIGKEIFFTVNLPISMLTSILRKVIFDTYSTTIIWDIQTGVTVGRINSPSPHQVMFHGDQKTISFLSCSSFGIDCYSTYDAFCGTELYQGHMSGGPHLGAYWAPGNTLQFAINSSTNGKLMVNIYELQPTSTFPLCLLSSFPILCYSEHFSFSPVSFHASFIENMKIIVLDVQSGKLLLEARVDHLKKGLFSPNGHFFACSTQPHVICVWQNTSTGYVLQSNLRPQLSFEKFSWSPTSTSILCWGSKGIQLLHPNNCHDSLLSPNEVQHYHIYSSKLLAYSADWAYIGIAEKYSGIITILDCLSGTPLQVINTDMKIRDIKIVNNTIFVVDMCKLSGWDLETNRVAYGGYGSGNMTINQTLAIGADAQWLALSHDCCQIAFTRGETVFLYDIKSQEILKSIKHHIVSDIQFSPDGSQLWFSSRGGISDCGYYFERLEVAEDWDSILVAKGSPVDGQLLFNLSSPHGYCIRRNSGWVVDSRGSKLLWLPPVWRAGYWDKVRWDGNFLALIISNQPEPIIIEFQL